MNIPAVDIPAFEPPLWLCIVAPLLFAYFVAWVFVRCQPRDRYIGDDHCGSQMDYRFIVWLLWPIAIPITLLYPQESRK